MLVIDFMDCADVRMVQRRGSLSFTLEASQRLRVFGNIVRQKLECNEAMQLHVLRFVDDTHPPATEFLDNAVMRDRPTDHDVQAEMVGVSRR